VFVLKEILHLDSSTHLNVFFANSSDEDVAGFATWPWDKEALTHLGRGETKTQTHSHSFMHAHSFAHMVNACTNPSLAPPIVEFKYLQLTPQALSVFILALTEKVIMKLRKPMNNTSSESYSSPTTILHYIRNGQ